MIEGRVIVFVVGMLSISNPLYAMKEAWKDSGDVISLSHSNIDDLNSVAWDFCKNPEKVATLDASNNALTSFQLAPVLKRFPSLKEVVLSYNKIQTITAEFLDGMPDQFKLDLSHNTISTISGVGDRCTKIGNHGIVIDLRGHRLDDKAIGILRSVIVRKLSLRDKAKSNAGSCGKVVGGLGCFGGCLIIAVGLAGLQGGWDPALARELLVGAGVGITASVSCCIAGIATSSRYKTRMPPNRLISNDEV